MQAKIKIIILAKLILDQFAPLSIKSVASILLLIFNKTALLQYLSLFWLYKSKKNVMS